MKGLSNNQLKLIALVSMTLDHIGAYLFPQILWLRIVGRLAFPIFAYMIAEGCRYTKNIGKYFATMALFALVCQTVDFVARKSLYQSILVTFTLSIGLVWLAKQAGRMKLLPRLVLLSVGVAGVYAFCEVLPGRLSGTNFAVDYGFLGVLVPVIVWMGTTKQQRMVGLTLALTALSAGSVQVQWFCLLALPLLLLYNGQRGKWKLKWLFYIYYPLHLVAIYGVSFLL